MIYVSHHRNHRRTIGQGGGVFIKHPLGLDQGLILFDNLIGGRNYLNLDSVKMGKGFDSLRWYRGGTCCHITHGQELPYQLPYRLVQNPGHIPDRCPFRKGYHYLFGRFGFELGIILLRNVVRFRIRDFRVFGDYLFFW